jgi:hypothetical protein
LDGSGAPPFQPDFDRNRFVWKRLQYNKLFLVEHTCILNWCPSYVIRIKQLRGGNKEIFYCNKSWMVLQVLAETDNVHGVITWNAIRKINIHKYGLTKEVSPMILDQAQLLKIIWPDECHQF